MNHCSVLGVKLRSGPLNEAVQSCLTWAKTPKARAVYFANVHMIMEAQDNVAFRNMLNAADMVNADGMPLVWLQHLLGAPSAQRVYGPDTTLSLLDEAEQSGVSVGFYGSTPVVLSRLVNRIQLRNTALNIRFVESPSFVPDTDEDDAIVVQKIIQSGVQLLFVGLGCPKQEIWIARHTTSIPAVMLGVGAAFDFIAGTKPQAPRWMMRCGAEWLFRLLTEPRRLLKRYAKHNLRFIRIALWQLLIRHEATRVHSAGD